jgi:cell division protein FtsL
MKLIIIAILLFVLIFCLSVPMKMQNDKVADLLSQEKNLEDSISVRRYDLSLLEMSIDSLSSRNRMDSVALRLGLGVHDVPTKITRYSK